jgi:hypothetical protein
MDDLPAEICRRPLARNQPICKAAVARRGSFGIIAPGDADAEALQAIAIACRA